MASSSGWKTGVVWSLFMQIFVHSALRLASAAELSGDEQIMLSIREELYNSNQENRAILDDQYNTSSDAGPCGWKGVICSNQTIVSVFMKFQGVYLQGPVPAGFGSLRNLTRLSLQGNRFSGAIPENIFNSSSSLELVDFSSNSLTGPIPTSVGTLRKLSILNLTDNSLTGTLMPLAGLKTFESISSIYLQKNEIGGNLSALEGMTSLVVLQLSSNNLTGGLSALRHLKKLQLLDLKNNQLSEDLTSIGDQNNWPSQLVYVDLASNQLSGGIFDQFFLAASRLYWLILSDNNLNEPIYQEVDSILETLQLDGNQLTGPIPRKVLNIISLLTLDMSRNSFVGTIEDFERRNALKNLDLSHNMLNGTIPETIFQMDQLAVANLSYNNFTGVLPAASNEFVNAHEYLFNDNPYLCSPNGGFNLTECSGSSPVPIAPPEGGAPYNQPSNSSDDSNSGDNLRTIAIWVGSVTAMILFVSLLVCLLLKYRKRSPRASDHADQQHPSFPLITAIQDGGKSIRVRTMKELRDATDNFSPSNQIGNGGFGTVYRGILDGEVVAIKKSDRVQSEEARRQILNEISVLSQVHHRNLVSLLGCCLTTNAAILVLEYVPKGTLADHLHGPRKVGLTWIQRLKISLQTAEALNYLHTAAYPPVFHQDVKSSNILLDNDFNAKVADFGISKLAREDVTHVTAYQIRGTLAYMDPDVQVSHHLTAKSDVYSFGVVLLELLTSKPAREFATRLSRWAAVLSDAKNMNLILDPVLKEEQELNNYEDFTSTAQGLGQLSFRCLQLSPEDRPSMREVVNILTVLNGVTVSSVKSGNSASDTERVFTTRTVELTEEYLQSLEQRSQGNSGDRSRTSSTSVTAAFRSPKSRKLGLDDQHEISFTASSSEEPPRKASESSSLQSATAALSSSSSRRPDPDSEHESTVTASSSGELPRNSPKPHSVVSVELQQVIRDENGMTRSNPLANRTAVPKSAR